VGARKLWGGITNQCRNLVITALAYGPDKPEWRHQFVGWTAAFAYVARTSLRGDRICSELPGLIGLEAASELARVNHKPSFVTLKLASLLMEACEKHGMDRFAFLQADKERAQLIDHIGGCERILKTPLPLVFAIKIRRYIALFLLTLPFVLLNKMPDDWLIPFVTMLVAYPLLSLDQISVELQNPFSKANLSHLPLDGFAVNIERNLRGLLADTQDKD
jgi:putative membrane protein